MEKVVLSFILVFMASVSAPAALTCKEQPSKDWGMINDEGKVVGHPQYSLTTEQNCKEQVDQSSNGDIVCAWNGQSYQFYNMLTNESLGSAAPQNFYKSANRDLCFAHAKLQPKTGGVVCAWNNGRYAPFNRTNNKLLAAKDSGWSSMEQCVTESASTATNKAVCSWMGGSYLVTLAGIVISPRFAGNFQECAGFQNLLLQAGVYDATIGALEEKATEIFSMEHLLPKAITNGEPDENVGFSLKNCAVREHRYHLTKSVGGYLVPECRPDTLYSWGGYEKLDWFASKLKDGTSWPSTMSRGLFTTNSAAATFGYGNVPLRIKIRPEVKMKILVNPSVSTCNELVSQGFVKNKEEYDKTILVRIVLRENGFSFQEYLICSAAVIESWSYLTSEHFDEMMKDYMWMTTKDYKYWEAYTKQNGVDVFIGNSVDSGADFYNTDFSQKRFNIRLGYIRLLTELNVGRVMTRKDQESLKENHFKTALPIYFNPE